MLLDSLFTCLCVKILVHPFASCLFFRFIIPWLHCKNHILRLIARKTSPQLLYGSTHRCSPTSLFKGFSCLCRGGPVCPPVREMILDFPNMSSKMTFLQ